MLDKQKRTTDVDFIFWQEWQKYQDYLYHCCLKWMEGNSTEAEDALSMAMLKAREKMEKNLQPIDNFKAWLTTITHNLCMDILKHNNHCIVGFEDIDAMCCSANILLVEGVSQGENPVLAAQEQELENFVGLAIDDLPGRLQETFKLYFQEEHSYQQIATELHISCPNVRKRISQARAILHKRLDEYEGTVEKTIFESEKKEKPEPEELPEEIVVAEASQEEVLPGEVQLSVTSYQLSVKSTSSFSRRLGNKNFLFYLLEMGGLRPYVLVRKQVIKSKLSDIRGAPVGEIYLPNIVRANGIRPYRCCIISYFA